MATKHRTTSRGTPVTAQENSQHSGMFRVEFVSNGVPCSTLAIGTSKSEVRETYNRMNTPSEPITVKKVTVA